MPMLDYFIKKYTDLLQNPLSLLNEEAEEEIEILRDLLIQFKKVREKDCNCELIPAKNEVIDSGFVCVHCGKIYGEYKGPKINLRDP
jgi:hypothetical protein